jgi:hypothetical protein
MLWTSSLELIRHDTVFFFHNKSMNSIFQPDFSAKRTGGENGDMFYNYFKEKRERVDFTVISIK